MKLFYDIDSNDIGGGSIAPVSGGVAPISAPAPTVAPKIPLTVPKTNPNLIPQPNYSDPASRSAYLKQWVGKYGNLEGRGDTVLDVNEVPRGATDTAKNMSVKVGSKYGIDPALLYSSASEEGMSGLFKSKATGLDTKNRKPGQFGYQDFYYDKDYPISGSNSFGLNTFADRFPDLVKKGYLTQDFAKNFRGAKSEDIDADLGRNDFKDTQSAMQAKAAMMKYHYDDIDSYAKARGIKLSPKARDFFALTEYNAGEGTGHSMLNDYHNNGYLENDKFLDKRPTTGRGLKESSYGPTRDDKGNVLNEGVYAHVARRLKMASNLKEQQLFDDK